MQAHPESHSSESAASPTIGFLVSHRIWVYLALLLLALAVILVDQREQQPSNSSAIPDGVAGPHRTVQPPA